MRYYYLYHHGIKGQRWGVRRFQKKDGSLTSAGKKRYDDTANKSDNDKDQTKKGLSQKQKKAIIIGASVAATALAAYGGYKFYQAYNGTNMKVDPETGFRLINKNMSDADNLRIVNPGRIRFGSLLYKNKEIINGSSTNCMLCTTAYDLRKRGYDVRGGLDLAKRGYFPDQLFSRIYQDYKGTSKTPGDGDPKKVYDDIKKFAKDQGHGSRGNIVVWWNETMGGGHSMIWENQNGNIVFKDGQTNAIYKDFTKEILSNTSKLKPVEMLRTDNLKINVENMKYFVNTDTTTKTYVKHGGEIAKAMWDEPVIQAGTAVTSMVVLSKAAKRQAVNQYKTQHPNTKLTDKEIAKLLKTQ